MSKLIAQTHHKNVHRISFYVQFQYMFKIYKLIKIAYKIWMKDITVCI